jgi:hypothetical protein
MGSRRKQYSRAGINEFGRRHAEPREAAVFSGAWRIEAGPEAGRKSMKCEKCDKPIDSEEAREHNGVTLCEDCYMDALSPARTCDPWAVYTAKSTLESGGTGAVLTETQEKILHILEETGGIEPGEIMERAGLKPADFEREIAALRHMEKLRGELRDGVKVICLW